MELIYHRFISKPKINLYPNLNLVSRRSVFYTISEVIYMKRLISNIAEIIIILFLMISGRSFAVSPQFPDIERMEIPKLELNIEVKKIPFSQELDTWDITEETGSVYWLEGSSHPEYGGNTVIAAHYMEYGEPGPLFRVRDLEEDDEIYLYSGDFKYTYKVDRYQYIPDTFMEYLKKRPYALTLFTCSGFNWDTGAWEQRVVVLADLVQIDFVDP